MQQDYVKSAVYSSLTKHLPSRCDPILDQGRCCPRVDPALVWVLEEEEEAMAYRESSELQLSRVSVGAQKLSRMIESLSRTPLHDGRSRHIAEGLLSGALDLQESLGILRRLQDASVAMSGRRANPNSDFGIEAFGSWRPSTPSSGLHHMLQGPRLSADGPSRNGCEGLKKVISDSLHRLNLLSNSSDDEKLSSSSASCSFDGGSHEPKKELYSDSTTVQLKKEKSRSLVAKLMGLEEIPSGTVQPQKKDNGNNKSFNQVKPGFNMEKLKAMKLASVEQIQDPKQKSLQEIIETMRFKGLLKSGQVEDQRIRSRSSRNFVPRKQGRDVFDDSEAPPIVVIKPSNLPSSGREAQKDLLSGKGTGKEEVHPFEFIRKKRVSDREWRLSRTPERKSVNRTEKTKLESFPEANSPVARIHRQHRKDAAVTCKKPDQTQKSPLNGKKQEVQNDMKATPISQSKTSPATGTKHDKRPLGKKDVSKQTSTLLKHSCNDSVKHSLHNTISAASKKKTPVEMPVGQSTLDEITSNNTKLVDGKGANFICESDSISVKRTLPAYDLPKQAEQEHRACEEDGTSMDQKNFCKVIPKTSEVEKKYESAEAVHFSDSKNVIRKASRIGCNIKHLLLSSQSFLSHAQELFTLNLQPPIYYQRKGQEDVITRNAKLFLDCGKEFLARKRHEQELSNHPLQQNRVRHCTVYYSLDQLVEEISCEIGDLIPCYDVDVNATSEGSPYIRREIDDHGCKDIMIDVISDVCSRNWICDQGSDQLATEVEEHILSFLVEEIITDSAC